MARVPCVFGPSIAELTARIAAIEARHADAEAESERSRASIRRGIR
ncbi:hypothetical protein FHX34_101735 [Actinoplanes teichomyceticus]|uniref:Uncharacterized protein n=1 Tax=Actinoplanes teichomyceticus TaxID=1867 RepID=A0A561WPK2_ACTTI|nr:hypothetical protein FHX34_101735 [Actinoplanes teichomyceticus]